jgi:2-(1,2-epoxy-1,2-dihydrophenyl)acetyl-CoA isomerase
MVYTADMYSAEEALAMGLVGEVVAGDQLLPHTMALARRIAKMPTLQLGLARMEILKGMSFDDPNASMMLEMFGLAVSQRSHDYEEGHVSFMEKREPRFTGH